MTSAQAVYAQRYRSVCLVLPRRPMTPAEWEAWCAGLSELGQVCARFSRSLSQATGRIGQTATSPERPRSVAIIMRPH